MKLKVLLTGASGFIGNELQSCLNKSLYDIYCLGKAKNNKYKNFIFGDISIKGEWINYVRKINPDIIIHLAGKINSNDKILLKKINIHGTKNLLDAVRDLSTWVFIASSSAVYGASYNNKKFIDEKTDCLPLNSYGKSKLAQEKIGLLKKYSNSKVKICIGRITNVIGPKQKDDFIIGKLLKKINKKELGNVNINFGNLNIFRDFIDIRDLCYAIKGLMENRCQGVYNIGSGKEILVRKLVSIILSRSTANISFKESDSLDVNPLKNQKTKINKLYQDINWKPKYSINDTIDYILKK